MINYFWSPSSGMMVSPKTIFPKPQQSILKGKKVMIRAGFDGHVGEDRKNLAQKDRISPLFNANPSDPSKPAGELP